MFEWLDNDDDFFIETLARWQRANESDRSKWKRRFTQLVNRLGKKYGPVLARENLLALVQRLEKDNPDDKVLRLASDRLSCWVGHFYFEGNSAMGWVDKNQVQAIPLPLVPFNRKTIVSFQWKHKKKAIYEAMGFYEPVPFPLTRYSDFWLVIRDIPEVGYGMAEENPIEVRENPNATEVVYNRKIIGFWKA